MTTRDTLDRILYDLHTWGVASHPEVRAAIAAARASDSPDLEGLRRLGERVRDSMQVMSIEG